MNKHAFSILGAAIMAFALLAPRPVAAQTVLQRCDKSMADAELMAKQVSECKRVLAAGTKSAADFAKAAATPLTPTAMKDVVLTTGAIPSDIAAAAMAEPKLIEHLVSYFSILAYDGRNPALCAPLSALRKDGACREAYGELSFKRGLIGTSAEFLKACRQDAVAESLNVKRPNIGEFCSLIAQNRAAPAAVCPQLTPLFEQAPQPGACVAFLSDPLRPGACRGLTVEDVAACRDNVVFASAFKAHDIAKCGASDACRVLMGAGKQVAQEQAAKLRSPAAQWFLKGGGRAVTKQVPVPVPQPGPTPPAAVAAAVQKALNFHGFVCEPPLQSEANRKAVASALGAAQLCLKDVETALTQVDVATSQGIDARNEKLARLQLQLTPLFEGGKAPQAPAKSPK